MPILIADRHYIAPAINRHLNDRHRKAVLFAYKIRKFFGYIELAQSSRGFTDFQSSHIEQGLLLRRYDSTSHRRPSRDKQSPARSYGITFRECRNIFRDRTIFLRLPPWGR
jgi:hypothetical protein